MQHGMTWHCKLHAMRGQVRSGLKLLCGAAIEFPLALMRSHFQDATREKQLSREKLLVSE
jgi:hypothetical protein